VLDYYEETAMSKETHLSAPSPKQQIFLKYLTWILVDLTVLNFFAEYWERVTITSFGISLFIAITLQVLLKMTIALEHRISKYMKSNEKLDKKIVHILSTWFILFASKFVMLWVLQFIFGDAIVFSGAYHGVVAFIVVVIAILVAEYLLGRVYKALA
jgi:c-di-AMP phosphodiesterase-like protein